MHPSYTASGASKSGIRTDIGGISIAALVRQFGTPFYAYDATLIRQRVAQLSAFDVVRYAQKANSNLAILELMRDAHVLLDAVSAGELARAEAAGYAFHGDPPPVVFTADLFDHAARQEVQRLQPHCNLGSPDMISQLAEICPGCDVTFRINPGFGHGHSQKTNTGGPQSKHGIWHEQLPECVATAERVGLRVSGLHMHIGSGTDFEHLARVTTAMQAAAAHVPSLRTISAGGGLPTSYQESDEPLDVAKYHDCWREAQQRLSEAAGRSVSLEIEPGRFLVADSGFLVCEIRAVKQMGPHTYYIVDAGFHNLARPILYGAYHPITLCPQPIAGEAEQPDRGPPQPVVVGGPLCESGDIFTQDDKGCVVPRRLPKATVGDWLVLECAGAYGSVMASNYNSQPLAPELLIEKAGVRCIRRRQTVAEMLALENGN